VSALVERIERRVFGAVEFIDDATGARVRDPLVLHADGLRLQPRADGLVVIREVDGEDAYTRAFEDPPLQPARQTFVLHVGDPRGRWLPMRFRIQLPRWLAAPGQPVDPADDALRPLALRLLPGPAAVLPPGWAVLRLRVAVDGPGPDAALPGLANVLVEATPAVAGLAPRRALTDRHGEALVVVPGAPPVLPDGGPLGLSTEFALALVLVLDPEVVVPAGTSEIPVPDLARIEQRRSDGVPGLRSVAAGPVSLSAGTRRRHLEKLTWP
jgi:hypothetical protein